MTDLIGNLLTASLHGSVIIIAVALLRLVPRIPRKYICLLWLLAGVRLLLPIQVKSSLSLQPVLDLGWLPALAGRGWLPWAAAVWAIVAAAFAVYSVVSYARLKRQVREAVRVRGGWECAGLETAFILGFIKPKIYIPAGMNSRDRRCILAHERTHLDKGDHWIKMVGFLALALHWFNPLVWLAYGLLCRDIETACDERVVRFMEVEERKGYSAALLTCSAARAHFAASPVAFGEISVRRRILSVLNYKRPSFWFSLVGVLAFAFTALCLLTTPEEQAAVRSPEEQAQYEQMVQCAQEAASALDREEFFYQLTVTDDAGSVQENADLYRQGADTLWQSTSGYTEAQTGRMVLGGQSYALREGQWLATDAQDQYWAQLRAALTWDMDTAQFQGWQDTELGGRNLIFTVNWSDGTAHACTVRAWYDQEGVLGGLVLERPNYQNVDRLHLDLNAWDLYGRDDAHTPREQLRLAQANIGSGSVSAQELELQAELDRWGVWLRMDDDVLTPRGVDVYYGQLPTAQRGVYTTEEYWLEKLVDGQWQALTPVTTPAWSQDRQSVGQTSTMIHLDWTGLYGELAPGEYRLGKTFQSDDSSYTRSHAFYTGFTIHAAIDSASPEAAAAVERCYAAVEALEARAHCHLRYNVGSAWTTELWYNGKDFLRIDDFGQDSDDPENIGRVDITLRLDDVGYCQVREDPALRSSPVTGLALTSLWAYGGGWDFHTDASDATPFFRRSNKTASFPEGVGVISDELVRFVLTWPLAGAEDVSAQLTYRFDQTGALTGMEYMPLYDEDLPVWRVEVLDTDAQQIDEEIKSYAQDVAIGSFSWTEAQEKYLGGSFNTRQDGFVNTQTSPITAAVDAARLALAEYPDLGDYLDLDIARDEAAGMWRVTIRSYIDYQETYAFRDVYLTDQGQTRLLVYEGPVRFDEDRA